MKSCKRNTGAVSTSIITMIPVSSRFYKNTCQKMTVFSTKVWKSFGMTSSMRPPGRKSSNGIMRPNSNLRLSRITLETTTLQWMRWSDSRRPWESKSILDLSQPNSTSKLLLKPYWWNRNNWEKNSKINEILTKIFWEKLFHHRFDKI